MSSEEIVWSPVMIYFLEKGRGGGELGDFKGEIHGF